MHFLANKLSCLNVSGEYVKKVLVLALALSLFASAPANSQTKFKVGLLVPNVENLSPFWTSFTTLAQAAANDLNIELKILYSRPNSYRLKRDGAKLLLGPGKLDYFLTGYWPEATEHHLKIAEKEQIKTFVVNTTVPPEVLNRIGLPRTRYRFWIGYMEPAEQQAAFDLADNLVKQIRLSGYRDIVRFVGLGGNGETYADPLRIKGLEKRLHPSKDSLLLDYKLTDWKRESAFNITTALINLYPNVNAVWAASDNMALGAIDAIKTAGKKPGKDIFVGGIDWSKEALDAVKRGEMAVSIGGHFLEGAQALVLIYDYHHGNDFSRELGTQWTIPMQSISKDNIRYYQKLLDGVDWSTADFSRLSKTLNPSVDKYDLSLLTLLTFIE